MTKRLQPIRPYDPRYEPRRRLLSPQAVIDAVPTTEELLRPGNTGHRCDACGVVTYGYSPTCGNCGKKRGTTA